MISLFDKTNQYIVAEATRTLSLQDDTVHEDGDGLWLGTTVLPRNSGICKLVVDPGGNFPDLADIFGLGGASYVIPDLKADARFKDVDFGPCAPFSRFYAGVPITTKEGAAIGSFCVLDDFPRDNLSPSLLQFMEHVSISIMSHLELTLARDHERRGQRMVTGLANFIAGKGSTQIKQNKNETKDTTNGRISPSLNSAREVPSKPEQSPGTSSPSQTIDSNDKVASPETSSPSQTVDSNGKVASRDETVTTNVQKICSRAANIIRESLEVEGVIFFDASVASFGDLRRGAAETSDTAESTQNISSGEDDRHFGPSGSPKNWSAGDDMEDSNGILGFSMVGDSSINRSIAGNSLALDKFLLELVKRHPKGKVFNFDEEGATYSGGSSSEGPNDPGLEIPSLSNRKSSRKASEKIVSETIIRTFPDARCVAMTPLWDSHRERWVAGVIAGSSSPNRILEAETDLSYLAAFGNTIMAEIAQVDSTLANKAKSALLGSISHELRSPLHGIMGGVEILEDSRLDAFQADVLHTVETCGKTLLDTVDHVSLKDMFYIRTILTRNLQLLDFSKINNSMQNDSLRKQSRHSNHFSAGRGRQKEINDIVGARPPIDLDVLVEEVIEVVFAGHGKRVLLPEHSRPSPPSITATAANTGSTSNGATFSHPAPYWKVQGLPSITVTLNIDQNASWVYKTQPGAWRRIVMNLFSNALKYTDQGFIEISLQAEHQLSTGDGEQSKVVFTIADSGRGMSKKYLQDRLYKPFAQENVLDPGTGLGLSIVQQIVTSLGGKINLRSIQGTGTTVRVSIPMMKGKLVHKGVAHDDLRDFRLVKQKTQGLHVCLVTPGKNDIPNMENTDPKDVTHFESRKSYLRDTLASICRDWFGMIPHFEPGNAAANLSIYLVVETPFNLAELSSGTFWENIPNQASLGGESQIPVVIVLCRSSESAYHLAHTQKDTIKSERTRIIEYITQPYVFIPAFATNHVSYYPPC
jgi:signal transduction histidine kinase